LLADLERARRNSVARGAKPGVVTRPGSISTADIGKLDWPVDGAIVTNFGREKLSSGATIKNNGISIAAAAGTPVKAVEAGQVERLFTMSTYGLSVILNHGDGYRSLYMNLKSTSVKQGADVAKGDVIGTVGGENTDEGAHLYFEIRGANGIALDPT